MTIKISIPTLSQNKNSIRDCIVSILSKKWPLTAKKIYNILKKEFCLGVTYQAVHKSLLQLKEEKVIIAKNKEYSLNADWIKKIKTFSTKLEEKYSNKDTESLSKEFTMLTFSTINEMDKFMSSLIKEFLTKDKIDTCCSHWRHFWWPLYITKDHYSTLKEIKESYKIYTTTSSNSAIEKWCSKVYAKAGVNIKLGIDLETNFDFFIYKDKVIQMYWPSKLKKSIDKIYNKAKKISDIDIDELFKEMFQKKTKINVVIMNNKDIAKELKEKVLSKF